MAEPSSQLLIPTLFFACIVLNFPAATLSDVPCQYPCYPPPAGTTVTPATPTATATTPPSVVSYAPPAGGVYPAPSGYYPYNNPPPNYGGYYAAQPPPDPILPYFPFYYKQPLHRSPDDQSYSSSTMSSFGRSAYYLLILFLFCFFY